MKFLVEVRIPTEVGNAGLLDGSFLRQQQKYLEDVKPEVVYFSAMHGQRTIYMVIDIQSADKLSQIAEPLWLDWKADVRFTPVMTGEDFEKAAPALQKVVEARK